MSRSNVADRLSEYLEGDLSERERARVESALAEDPALRAELRELEATLSLLRGLPQPEVPSALAQRVMARVRDGEAEPRRALAWLGRLLEPAVAAPLAAGIVALAVFAGTRDAAAPALQSAPLVATAPAPRLAEPVALAAAGIPESPREREMIRLQRQNLQTLMARHQHPDDLARVLRGAGHPHAASLAPHFDARGEMDFQVVSFQAPIRVR